MKRDCLIVLVSICLITMSAPQGLGKGSQAADGFSQETPRTSQMEGSVQVKEKQPQADRSASPRPPTKEDSRADQIKWKVRSLGIAARVTIILNSGNERYGSVELIDDDSFQLAEVDLKQVFTIGYSEVKKVREGYGNTNRFTGKRWNPIWAKISVVAVIVMFAVVIPLSVPRT